MLKKLLRTFVLSVACWYVVIFSASGVFAADDASVQALFKRGSILFRQNKFVSASLDFKDITKNYPSSTWAVPAHMMLAKTYFQLGEFEEAESTARTLRSRYPQNRYTDWTFYLAAACRFKLGSYEEAASLLCELAGSTRNDELRSRIFSALKYTVAPTVDSDVFAELLAANGIDLSDIDRVRPIGSYDEAEKGEDLLTDSSTVSPSRDWESARTYKIGLLAPLSGVNADLGSQLLTGVRTVIDRSGKINDTTVELIVEDTESDLVTTALKTRKLINEGVIAIIGPVLSESNIVAALEAQAHGIPFIAPTATDYELTRLGSSIFQLNVNPVVQAEALAEFAVKTLHFRNFAILASDDLWGRAVSRTFSREMTAKGAENVWTDFITPEESLHNHEALMNIREHAPESETTVDSLIVINHGNAFPDTIIVRQDILYRGERRLGPVNSVDCILISAFSEQAVHIASKIMEYNIITVILGDSGWWSNAKAFEGGEEYIEGAYVVAPPGELSGGLGMSYLNTVSGTADTRDIPLMKGADALNLILYCLRREAHDPDAITKMLRSIRDFRGIASNVTIDPERRTNLKVEFIRIQDGAYMVVNNGATLRSD